ncbi:cyclase family protein [Microbulbifer sp. YPW16]|uniref:cyclase family protein n=1 Tax=Microbulbifer sp. YPW16 TaxID=2904242 RepID=UPI001E334827|nr:cyclase family protein [Microbulbifer sp. YPW16]UHQ55373.1 cyclase family protein [Microbulbifer sp. YPW16]
MATFLELGRVRYRLCHERASSIAIPLDFSGPQPNHFGVPTATVTTVEGGGFVGDTSRGGSCNVRTLQLTPHCNGTHTESISHIVDDEVAVGELPLPILQNAVLLSVQPVQLAESNEGYWPNPEATDSVVTRHALLEALDNTGFPERLGDCPALVIRTQPNSPEKCALEYGEDCPPVFLSLEAMEWISQNFDHLLVDFPSVDKMYDEGQLANHRQFWHVPRGITKMDDTAHAMRTITEMIFVPDALPDGYYGLNLQVPAFRTDAAPSRPILVPLEEE